MRSSTLFSLLAFFCIIFIAFVSATEVEKVEKVVPVVQTTHDNNDAQFKALQDQIAKLTADLTQMGKSISSYQQENKDLAKKLEKAQTTADAADAAAKSAAKSAATPKEDVKINQLEQTVDALRKKLEQMGKQIAGMTIAAQLHHGLTIAMTFANETVAPKVEEGAKIAMIYAKQAQTAVLPYLGQTQSLLSVVYHQVRAYHTKFKDIFVQKLNPIIDPLVKQVKAIPAEFRPIVVELLWSAVVFFALFLAFIVCYGIWITIIRTICCCGRKKQQLQLRKDAQQQQQQQQKSKK